MISRRKEITTQGNMPAPISAETMTPWFVLIAAVDVVESIEP